MYEVHCLFNFDDVNHRLTLHTESESRVLNYEDLKRGLSIHPKLKDIDFFDESKYVMEIFDKTFQEYIKLSRDTSIPDYTKLRSRLRPKSRLSVGNTGEGSKRFLVYTENTKEEEQATQALKDTSSSFKNEKSTPPKHSNPIPVKASSGPRNPNRGKNSYQDPSKQHQQSYRKDSDENRYGRQTMRPNRPSSPPSKISKTISEPQIITTSHVQTIAEKPTQLQERKQPPQPSQRPAKPPSPPHVEIIKPAPEFKNNGHHERVENVDMSSKPVEGGKKNIVLLKERFSVMNISEKHELVKTVLKYNDEFKEIVVFDDIWNTENVWKFVWRELEIKGVRDIPNLQAARQTFKFMVNTYKEVLKLTNLTCREAEVVWPFFDIFHYNLNIRPFDEDAVKLKQQFDEADKTDAGDDSFDKKSVVVITPPAKIPPPIVTLSDTPKKPEPMETALPETIKESEQPVIINNDDYRLLLSVEDHNKEFLNIIVPEFSVWREVTDQMKLFEPFEDDEIEKTRSRFFVLLKEFLRIEKSDKSEEEKDKWELYGSFKNLDLKPFLDKL